jgi:hypothetical protein
MPVPPPSVLHERARDRCSRSVSERGARLCYQPCSSIVPIEHGRFEPVGLGQPLTTPGVMDVGAQNHTPLQPLARRQDEVINSQSMAKRAVKWMALIAYRPVQPVHHHLQRVTGQLQAQNTVPLTGGPLPVCRRLHRSSGPRRRCFAPTRLKHQPDATWRRSLPACKGSSALRCSLKNITIAQVRALQMGNDQAASQRFTSWSR